MIKHFKIDFALLTIISMIGLYIDKWFGVFDMEIETWGNIILACFVIFIFFAIIEKVYILIQKKQGKKNE